MHGIQFVFNDENNIRLDEVKRIVESIHRKHRMIIVFNLEQVLMINHLFFFFNFSLQTVLNFKIKISF